MALMKTMSAHARSLSFRCGVTLRSTRRLFQIFGRSAATVISPSGGDNARFRMNFSACLKLQNVSGNSG
jgi:hypothetical protein